MDTDNPTHQSRQRRGSLPSSHFHPLCVTLVVEELGQQASLESAITNLRALCRDLTIVFTTREYNPNRYRHDRDEIARLPALHFHKHGYHVKTFYLNTRPVQIIEDAVFNYVTELELKKERVNRWRSIPGRIHAFITGLLHRKTHMERAQEEQQVRSTSVSQRRGSIRDWKKN